MSFVIDSEPVYILMWKWSNDHSSDENFTTCIVKLYTAYLLGRYHATYSTALDMKVGFQGFRLVIDLGTALSEPLLHVYIVWSTHLKHFHKLLLRKNNDPIGSRLLRLHRRALYGIDFLIPFRALSSSSRHVLRTIIQMCS